MTFLDLSPWYCADFRSQWELMPKDVLSKVFAHGSSLSCIARQVCKAWREHSISCPVALDISLASLDEQTSLGTWLRSHEARPAPAEVAGLAGDLSSCPDVNICLSPGQHASDEMASKQHSLPNAPLADTQPLPLHEHEVRQTKPPHEVVQHISSLKLYIWLDLNRLVDIHRETTQTLLAAIKSAHIAELTLGEFLSNVFCHLGYLMFLPPIPHASSTLQSLTLHLDAYGSQDMFHDSCLGVLSLLTKLKSLTLKACENDMVNNVRTKQQVPAALLLTSLPASIQALSLQNFRSRWQAFGDLSSRPHLVSLDLTQSSCIFPADPQAWTQLRHLTLRGSAVWLQQGQPFLFSALTQLTQLDLKGCSFASFAPGQVGNTHQYLYRQLQVPTSMVSLNLSTKSIQVSFFGTKPWSLSHCCIYISTAGVSSLP